MLVTDPSGSMLDTVDHLVRRIFVDNMPSEAGCIHTIAWGAAGSDPATHAARQAHMIAVDQLRERNVSLALDTWGLALRPPDAGCSTRSRRP
jgi:hypothetical protein